MEKQKEGMAMRCPYCNQEMEKGSIQSPYEIAWLKGTKRHLFSNSELHPDSLVLSEHSFLSGSAVIAHFCRKCGKIVIDTEDESSDLNH